MKLTKLALYALILALPATLPASAQNIVRLATTTSTENSGLLATLLPAYEARTGHKVHVIAVGSGKALELARKGDVDVVLVHSRQEEDRFVADGKGVGRRDVMFNDFVLVCPQNDPAGIAGGKDVVTAFRQIHARGVRFVSRGDRSGTEVMEKSYWQAAGAVPAGKQYVSAGLGMGEVLFMAGEMQACTLSDRATFHRYQAKSGLAVMVEGDPRMFNPYGIIAVNPQRHPGVNSRGACSLIDWITSDEGRRGIAAFRPAGQQLFFPLPVAGHAASVSACAGER